MAEDVVKTSAEERAVAFAWDAGPGERIVEDLGWTVVPQDLEPDGLALAALGLAAAGAAGPRTVAVLTGGRPGHVYHVSNRVRTSAGRVLRRGVMVRVVERVFSDAD